MTITKKMLLLTIAAIATLAIAGPASASAVQWVGPELTEPAETAYSGPVEFFFPSLSSGIVCNAEADATLQPGNSGSVSGFALKSCSGTGEFFEGCVFSKAGSEALPWSLNAEGGAIDLKTLKASFSLKTCMSYSLKLAFTDVSLTPDNPSSISKLTASGDKATISVNGGKFIPYELNVNGTLNASQPGVYGIGVGDRWITTNPKPLEKSATVEVSGSLGWEWSNANGVNCTNVHGTLTLLPGSEAEVGELKVNPASCSGFGTLLKECKVTEAFATSKGAVGATSSGKVRFTELRFRNIFTGCMSYAFAWGEVNAVPDNPSQISKLSIYEPVEIETGYGLGSGWMTGSLNVLPAGKYGIDY